METDEHREKDDKEVDKDSLQTSECREKNSVEESKKDSESARTGNTDSPEIIVRTVQQQVKRMELVGIFFLHIVIFVHSCMKVSILW